MLEETNDTEELIERVAALDIGKAELVCCVRVPARDRAGQAAAGGGDLLDHDPVAAGDGRPARRLGVTRVVMEATSDYWKAAVLPAGGGRVRGLAGQRPGREEPAGPAEDRQAGRGLAVQGRRAADAAAQLRAAAADPPAAGPDPYRTDLVAVRTAEKQRVEKLLEDAQIKLSVVASDIFGVSGPGDAGRTGRRGAGPQGAGPAGPGPDARKDRPVGGGLHRPLQRPSRVPAGQDAGPHRRRPAPTSPSWRPRSRSEIAPFAAAVDRLDEITGVGRTAAQVIIAEVGLDMSRVPHPRPPGLLGRSSRRGSSSRPAERRATATTGHGNRYLARRARRGRRRPPAGPTPSWGNATGASPAAAAPRRPSSRSAAPS